MNYHLYRMVLYTQLPMNHIPYLYYIYTAAADSHSSSLTTTQMTHTFHHLKNAINNPTNDSYFSGLKMQLQRLYFDDDDLLQ